jgi:biopolymer transport protein ExbD
MIKRRPRELVDPDLPITPMLDMSFQLMAFFILTFRPMPTEAQLPLALPKSEGAENAPPPSLDFPIEDEELIVQVYATDTGQIADITLALKTGNVPFKTDTSALFAELKVKAKAAEAAGQKPPRLRFEFAERLNYQFEIKMIDEARRAGFDRISPTLMSTGKR